MKLSTTQIRVLGLVSFWPLTYVLLFIGYVMKLILGFFFASAEPSFQTIAGTAGIHLMTAILVLGLMAFYTVHALTNRRLNDSSRLMWLVGLFGAGLVTFPLYYWMFIRPRPPRARRVEAEGHGG